MSNLAPKDILLSVFKDLMERPDLTAEDNLLDQGLNSLQAVGASMIARNQGIGFQPHQINSHPRIIDLTQVIIDRRKTAKAKTASQSYPPHPFTPTQRSWQEGGFLRHYNVYNAWQFEAGQLDLTILDKALQKLCASQEELRLRIYENDGKLVQQVVDDSHIPQLEIVDLTNEPEEQKVPRVITTTCKMQYSFEFRKDQPLFRFVVFQLDKTGRGWFFILFHHYMVDGFGFGVFLRKLSEAYLAIANGQASQIDIGSGAARAWAERMTQYAAEDAPKELPFWQTLPWQKIKDGLTTEFVPPLAQDEYADRFNEADAQELSDFQSGKKLTPERLRQVFESQATIVDYLDPDASDKFLGHNWRSLVFNDYDLFALSVGHALARFAPSKMLWLDMLGAARTGVFDDLDVSSTVGYISELTPFLVDLCDGDDVKAGAERLHRMRESLPRQGAGLRAMKYLSQDAAVQKAVASMPLPQAGINYHASLQFTVPHQLLDLKQVGTWLGPTMDERGIAYRFWFRVSYSGGRLQMLMRYDPKAYSVDTAMRVVADTKANLERALRVLGIVG